MANSVLHLHRALDTPEEVWLVSIRGIEKVLVFDCRMAGVVRQDNNVKQSRPLPDVGFRWAEEGSRMPPVVASSASATLASTRSPLGMTCAVESLS